MRTSRLCSNLPAHCVLVPCCHNCGQGGVWAGVHQMHSFGTACPAQTQACVSTRLRLIVVFLTFSALAQGVNAQEELYFPLKMPDCCLNLLCLPYGRMLPLWWAVCRVVTGTLNCYRARARTVRTLCTDAPKVRPDTRLAETPMVCPYNTDLLKAQRDAPKQFLFVIIFSGGILSCPYPMIPIDTQKGVRLQQGPPD